MVHEKAKKLLDGETLTTCERGNSMLPLIQSGQFHKLEPVKWEDVRKNDIVYCKVRGRYYTHKVWQVDPVRGCLIGNAKGRKNGWTKLVYGRVTEIHSLTLKIKKMKKT